MMIALNPDMNNVELSKLPISSNESIVIDMALLCRDAFSEFRGTLISVLIAKNCYPRQIIELDYKNPILTDNGYKKFLDVQKGNLEEQISSLKVQKKGFSGKVDGQYYLLTLSDTEGPIKYISSYQGTKERVVSLSSISGGSLLQEIIDIGIEKIYACAVAGENCVPISSVAEVVAGKALLTKEQPEDGSSAFLLGPAQIKEFPVYNDEIILPEYPVAKRASKITAGSIVVTAEAHSVSSFLAPMYFPEAIDTLCLTRKLFVISPSKSDTQYGQQLFQWFKDTNNTIYQFVFSDNAGKYPVVVSQMKSMFVPVKDESIDLSVKMQQLDEASKEIAQLEKRVLEAKQKIKELL